MGGQLSKAATQTDVIGARKLAVDRDVLALETPTWPHW